MKNWTVSPHLSSFLFEGLVHLILPCAYLSSTCYVELLEGENLCLALANIPKP